MAADDPERLARFRRNYGLERFVTLLSDPELTVAEALDVSVSRNHPMAKRYPRGAFLQPGLFIWLRNGELAHQWRQKPSVINGWGAMWRPSPEQILDRVRNALG